MPTIEDTVFEYEKYELKLSHYVVESSGRRVNLDEPATCTMCVPIGDPVPESHILNKLFYEMKRHICGLE